MQNSEDELKKLREEVERASNFYYYSSQQQGIDNKTKRFVIESCEPYFKGNRVLELGYIDGIWTDVILNKGYNIDIVEGAKKQVVHAELKYKNNSKVKVVHQLFQEFTPSYKYNTIVAADILRYIPKPLEFLTNISDWLEDDGHLIVTVPNSRSFHRRIGVLLNMEATPTVQNKRDLEVGNIRSYDRYELRHLLISSGYNVIELHGCFLKPLSSEQMKDWDHSLLRAFFDIGKELEDYCWFIYVICTKVK